MTEAEDDPPFQVQKVDCASPYLTPQMTMGQTWKVDGGMGSGQWRPTY